MLDSNQRNFSIYNLYNYGITIGFLDKLKENSITISDIFVNGDECLLTITNSKSKINEVVEKSREMVESKDYRMCSIELRNYGLSKRICDKLVKENVNVEDLYDLSDSELNQKCSLGEVTISKIRKALENFNFEFSPQNEKIIIHVLSEIDVENISIIALKNILTSNPLYIEGDLIEELENLKRDKKIEYTPYGIQLRKTRILEFVDKCLTEDERKILFMRAEGGTLEDVGNVFNVTRERIRQKEKKILSKIPNVYEDFLSSHFETYDFSSEMFKKVFGQDDLTYFYLSKKYEKGSKSVEDILESDSLNDSQKEIIRNELNIISIGGEYLKASKQVFLMHVVEKYAKESIRIEDFFEIYNKIASFHPNYDFEEENIRSLEGKLERHESVIMGKNHKLRFYKQEVLTDDAIRKIKYIILANDGFYSTKYFVDNYSDLIKELGVYDEYELHNLLKKFVEFNDGVQFLRMPNILINCNNKEEFIYDKINELSPISVNGVADILCDDYGHKKSTMMSYLLSNFEHLIYSGKFYIEHEFKMENHIVDLLKEKFKSDIHMISEVKSVFKEHLGDDSHKYINGLVLEKIGYSIKSGYILSSKYNTIPDYLNDVINNREFLVFEDRRIKNIPAINAVINRLERSLDIIKTDEFRYITRNKLDEIGLTKSVLTALSTEIYDKFRDEDFYNLDMVRLDVDLSMVDDFGFEDVFLESMISSHDKINTLTAAHTKVFTSQFDDINTTKFLELLVYKFGNISVYDLKVYIYEKFNVDFSESKIKDLIKPTDLVYMEIMDKIYVNKDDYYEEVYNEKN